jgi:hypothetical protein
LPGQGGLINPNHLVLSNRASNEDDNSLPLIFVLAMFQGELRYLHRAGQIRLPFNIQVLQRTITLFKAMVEVRPSLSIFQSMHSSRSMPVLTN